MMIEFLVLVSLVLFIYLHRSYIEERKVRRQAEYESERAALYQKNLSLREQYIAINEKHAELSGKIRADLDELRKEVNALNLKSGMRLK